MANEESTVIILSEDSSGHYLERYLYSIQKYNNEMHHVNSCKDISKFNILYYNGLLIVFVRRKTLL